MRFIIPLFFFILLNNAKAEISPLLRCLALEEQQFHQNKIINPFYRLNQKMLLMISQFPKLITEDKVLNAVCKAKKDEHPSMILLENFLLNPDKIFTINYDIETEQQALLDNTLKEMKEGTPDLLITFLADLQSTLEVANCLNLKIEEAAYFTERFKYLQSAVSHEQLFENKKKISGLFDKLRNWQNIEQACLKPKVQMRSKN